MTWFDAVIGVVIVAIGFVRRMVVHFSLLACGSMCAFVGSRGVKSRYDVDAKFHRVSPGHRRRRK